MSEIFSRIGLGLSFFGSAVRWRWFRDTVLQLPVVGLWFLSKVKNGSGMGWLMSEADRQVEEGRKYLCSNTFEVFGCLEARFSDGSPPTASQKRAHVTLLIQAGADTTDTAMGCTLRFLVTNPSALAKARKEIARVDKANLLSTPDQSEETRQHLPYYVACIKEGLRL
ncbi:hypothetical protein BU25DRAFT_419009 [Macroventuria anomochaeta]|uniref:Uncharacterized protein n=1 Tax=Macroventuria anomochaeta TaxID=301207 RepID=A0ACB6SAN7_9PLEO|nr:uncharacterized protein BU25DRAFT_419009 [Macroventuria anomochaeta]KAF2630655.1 hypothetical protein BU25DRAFT_419009 [Macroventuria anomochaeta]